MAKYFSLDVLRVFAGVWVVAFHTILAHEAAWGISSAWFKSFLMDGYKGVGLFFALSAYLITHSMSKKSTSPREFLLKRCFKILPLYWFLSILFFILSKFDALRINSQFELSDIFSSLFFLSQSLLSKPPVLYVGWSLEFEVLYYLIMYGVLLIGIRVQILVLLILFFLSIFLNPMFAYFIVGILFHNIMVRPVVFEAYRNFNVCISYVCLGFCLVYINDYYIGIFLLACGFTIYNPFKSLWVGMGRCFSFLAAATYSIYLVQVFTIPVVLKYLVYVDLKLPLGPTVLMSVFFTVLIGVGFYVVIEKPAETFLLKSVLSSSKVIR